MVLLSVQGMDVAGIAKVTFTSPDRVREVINNFNEDGFESLYPRYSGGRPPTFTLPQRQADQEDRPVAARRPRAALLDLEPDQAGRVPGRRGGGRRHQPRGPPGAAPKGGGVLSSRKDLEAVRPTPTTRPRRTGCSSCTTSPKARPARAPATRRWCSPWTSSARSTCCPGPASSGRRWCAGTTKGSTAVAAPAAACGPPTSAPRASATCSPRST